MQVQAWCSVSERRRERPPEFSRIPGGPAGTGLRYPQRSQERAQSRGSSSSGSAQRWPQPLHHQQPETFPEQNQDRETGGLLGARLAGQRRPPGEPQNWRGAGQRSAFCDYQQPDFPLQVDMQLLTFYPGGKAHSVTS